MYGPNWIENLKNGVITLESPNHAHVPPRGIPILKSTPLLAMIITRKSKIYNGMLQQLFQRIIIHVPLVGMCVANESSLDEPKKVFI